MQQDLDGYVRRFSKLRTDRSRYKGFERTQERAPHKPLLLLAVIAQFEQGTITSNLIELTPDLSDAFRSYWYRVMPPDTDGRVVYPFFHLKSDGFWHLIPRPGKEAILQSKRAIRSVGELNEVVGGVQLDDALFELLQHPENRNVLTTTLLQGYFAEEVHQTLLEQSAINVEAFRYSQALLQKIKPQKAEEESEPVRSQGFRRAVVTAYDHRCAMSGIRIVTPDGHSVVNAAHIVPWRVSHDDAPSNGLALSPLFHWAFDEGLVSINAGYRIVLSPHLRAADNIAGDLLALEKREIILPTDRDFWPDLQALEYHRKHVFFR